MKRSLGVCWYPEHWPREIWAEDARRMADAGLTWVRIGEFAWSRLEPQPGQFEFDWLDEAISTLGEAGLKVILGTPTATPPRWMLDRHPDMLALDAEGRERKFGSRRHYCFSHEGYRAECARIVTRLAKRYGRNPHIAAWQTDNEYGCHDTTLSFSEAARCAFQGWLRARYPGSGNDGDIDALNSAWGNVFWSMDYDNFDQTGLPNLTVTEPNPSHLMDFRRFSSDQVISFNRLQAEIIRAHSDAPITHNYMGRVTDFDHYKLGDDLDIASWDSYPLGFLEDRVKATDAHKRAYARQGDPDFQAFHHDLYRSVGKGRWWVMEQQPGPVNWAPFNPAPLPGMVRLWSWEAFAHGAEAVCYFRWRQAPMAQEQMHAGLLRPDSAAAPGLEEAQRVAKELADAPDVAPAQADVALIFDYEAEWAWSIQPHGRDLSYFDLVFDFYRGMRKLGLSIDIAPPGADLAGYRLIVAPGLMHMSAEMKSTLSESSAIWLLGPRTGARNSSMQTPVPLPPALPGWSLTVTHVESLRPDMPLPLQSEGAIISYREFVEGDFEVTERLEDESPAVVKQGKLTWLCGWPDETALRRILRAAAEEADIAVLDMAEGVRRRKTGRECFWFNHATETRQMGGRTLPALSVTRDMTGR